MRVRSVNGHGVGQIETVDGTKFSLKQGESLTWLPLDCVFTVDEGVVNLECNADQIPRYAITAV